MEDDEKKELLVNDEVADLSSPPSYGTSEGASRPAEDTINSEPTVIKGGFIFRHRHVIPGYGVYRMIRGVKPYAHWVLLMMLLVYLINQLDRYTLPIVVTEIGYDLEYGDEMCMVNKELNHTVLDEFETITMRCSNQSYDGLDIKNNETNCNNSIDVKFEWGNKTFDACRWWYSGTGILYEVVAGPVFNNLYIVAGIFTGFLADYGRRTVWLVICLVIWSLAVGVTGFVTSYWQLVLLRAVLAIGAAGCSPFAVSILADYYPPEFRGTSVGFYYWGIYIGYSLSFAIGNGIKQTIGWRWVFFLSGIIGLAAAPLVLFTVKEPPRSQNKAVDKAGKSEKKLSLKERIVLLLKTFFMPGMLMLCLAGGIRNAGGYVWAYHTELFFEEVGYSSTTIQQWMSWIPLVAGSIGAVVGGLISDILVKGRSPYMRIWVLIISQMAAAPFALGALFLPYPWCFLSLLPSNIIGEMWVGVTTALVVDLAPSRVRTGAVSIYLFIITLIGGNFNLLVTPILNAIQQSLPHLLSLRITLSVTFPGVYVLSSLLFIATFFLMRSDLRKKARLEAEGTSTKPV
ncbi:MFS-type efflux pump MSMEG_3705-like isoform X2 [Halichondria panicea]|uniref:MFS-type efflux pump MSMEG_3705-like isoform X2 n=1 Tax=Halichondria panicea TaxID=6063 RepID=UPI00312B8851